MGHCVFCDRRWSNCGHPSDCPQNQDDVDECQRIGQVTRFHKESAMKVLRSIRRFVRDEDGTESLEWGLICGLIVVGGIIAITAIGPKVTKMWNDTNTAIP